MPDIIDESLDQGLESSPAKLLPPSWESSSLKKLVPLCSPPCNCNNNPTSTCCLKVCGRSKAFVDHEVSTPLIALCSPPCNCNNNPTSTCCLKVCGRSNAVDHQGASTSLDEASEINNTQKTLSNIGTESGESQGVQSHEPASCPCDCDNPTTPCCIKICVNLLQARLNQQLPSSSAAATGSSEENASMPETEAGAGFVGSESDDDGRRNGADLGMVALRTSSGSFLPVEAEFNLDLYASFVSTDLMHKLGLAVQHFALANEASKLTINGQSHTVVGTSTITVEAYARKMPAFEDVFYVFESSHGNVRKHTPELVFGIDHVRQAEGLIVSPNFLG
jgi:hypothetical protein